MHDESYFICDKFNNEDINYNQDSVYINIFEKLNIVNKTLKDF